MVKRARILSLGLAMALFMAQTSYGEILITPLDTAKEAAQKVESQKETVQNSEGQKESVQEAEGQNAEAGSNVGPGFEEESEESGGKTEPGSGGNAGSAGNAGTETGTYVTDIKTPEIAAEAAVLYDVTHDKVLFEKNAGEKLYPASITKLMTALLVLEKANLTDTVTFSKTAVTNLESGAVTLGLQEGDKVSVKDCLYGLLLKSANEVANGLAEHVGGSISGFADMMNAKAAELGCTNTHFVNPNGLNDSNHYTTCLDMAKIAKAAFANPTLCEIASALSYEFPATKSSAARTITPGHKMLYPTDSRYYEGIIGGKTGYTSLAGNTLVTCTEKDGVRLIAVVLKAKSTHYTDTKALLDYGYELNGAGLLTAQTGNGTPQTGSGASQASGAGSGAAQAGNGAAQTPGTGNAGSNRWVQDGNDWRFVLADGTSLSDCIVLIDGVEYGFDSDGKMQTGWKKYGENWYCFKESGAMIKNEWMQDGGSWFYLGSDGAMVRNAWIDNTYYVGADGVWVQQ